MDSTNKTIKFNKENIVKNKEISKVFKLNLVTFVGLGAIILGQLVLAVLLIANLGKAAPTMVQTPTASLKVKPMPNTYRSEATITDFNKKVLTLMFTWDGYLMPTSPVDVKNPVTDEGIKIKTNKGEVAIPTRAYEASFALESLFREQYLAQLATLIPKKAIDGELQLVFLPKEMLPPEEVSEGRYKQSVIANILVFGDSGKKLVSILPFRKTIVLNSVMPTNYAEVETKEALLVNEYRQHGLEIVDIQEYETTGNRQ